MAVQTIEVETSKIKVPGPDGKEVNQKTSFQYDFGDSLADATAKFGESVVFSLYKAKAVIEVQDKARNALVAGKSPEDAAQLATTHKLGESTAIAKDPVQGAMNVLEKMSAEERQAFIKALQAKSKELAA